MNGLPAPCACPRPTGRAPLAPDARLTLGFVGVANMGTTNLKEFLPRADVRVAAVCDVDARHLAAAKALVDAHYGNRDCLAFHDFRELHRRPDIDAVVISTPDHWHALMAIDAAGNGKDIYLEKPFSLTVADGRATVDAIRRHGRVCQTGSQCRSRPEFRHACELVRNGRLGRLHMIEVGLPPNNKTCEPTWQPMPVPDGFDYDLWLGPAPWAEYHEQRCHYTFRFLLEYSGGQVTNFGAHHLDLAQWALGEDHSGPVEVSGQGEFPASGLFTTATKVDVEFRYANGVRLVCRTGDSGVRFLGDAGQVIVRWGKLETEPAALATATFGPADVRLYASNDHHGDFLDCVRARRLPICHAEIGHRSATACHLANIAMRLGRKLAWDPARERFANDAEANAMLSRPYRALWTLAAG